MLYETPSTLTASETALLSSHRELATSLEEEPAHPSGLELNNGLTGFGCFEVRDRDLQGFSVQGKLAEDVTCGQGQERVDVVERVSVEQDWPAPGSVPITSAVVWARYSERGWASLISCSIESLFGEAAG